MMKVISNDGQEFEIDHGIAQQSTLLKSFFVDEEKDIDGIIPLDEVKGSILKSIIDYCDYHKNDRQLEAIEDQNSNRYISKPRRAIDISEWDQSFFRQFPLQDGPLFDIIMAANYLGIKTLSDAACRTIAILISNKSPSEVRDMFNIPSSPHAPEATVNEIVIESAETSLGNDQTSTSESNATNP